MKSDQNISSGDSLFAVCNKLRTMLAISRQSDCVTEVNNYANPKNHRDHITGIFSFSWITIAVKRHTLGWVFSTLCYSFLSMYRQAEKYILEFY